MKSLLQQQQQQPPLPQEGKGDEEQKPKSVQPGESIFDGDEMDLVGMYASLDRHTVETVCRVTVYRVKPDIG